MKRTKYNLPTIDEALKTYWGYDSFRPKQRDIIESIVAGRDTLALLPTGGGKSLTYQVPALTLPGVCIVITPLIALMKDQVDRLRRIGVPAVAIHGGMSYRAIDATLDNASFGSVKIVYIAPERLFSKSFRLRLDRIKVSLIAVDEAHCISQWGYDFRPSYLRIGELRAVKPGVPILALTASATPDVCKDIMEKLLFKDGRLLRGSFARPNLSYAVRNGEDRDGLVLRILGSIEGSAIIYARTRRSCENITEFLNKEGHDATFYHGGLPNTERSLRQDEWLSGETRIMVATNAFGMGIDKPDVRVVIHYMMCDSLEAYYQEAGRAGRDGNRSYAVLISSTNDYKSVTRCLENDFPSLDKIKDIYDKLCNSLNIVYGEGEGGSFSFDLREFCRSTSIYSDIVMNSLKILQMNNYLTYVEEMDRATLIYFTVNRDDLYKIRVKDPTLDSFILTLLRNYDGIFNDYVAIDETFLSLTSGYTVDQVREKLKQLWRLRLIKYIPTNRTAMIVMESPRLPMSDLYISPQSYKYRKELYQKRLEDIISYCENNDRCRSAFLEEYFGIIDPKDCGACDICIAKRRKMRSKEDLAQKESMLREQILEALKNRGCSIKELAILVNADSQQLVIQVDKMLQDGVLYMDTHDNICHG